MDRDLSALKSTIQRRFALGILALNFVLPPSFLLSLVLSAKHLAPGLDVRGGPFAFLAVVGLAVFMIGAYILFVYLFFWGARARLGRATVRAVLVARDEYAQRPPPLRMRLFYAVAGVDWR